jgi:hypothetical protein
MEIQTKAGQQRKKKRNKVSLVIKFLSGFFVPIIVEIVLRLLDVVKGYYPIVLTVLAFLGSGVFILAYRRFDVNKLKVIGGVILIAEAAALLTFSLLGFRLEAPSGVPAASGPVFAVYPAYSPTGKMGDVGDIEIKYGEDSVIFVYRPQGNKPYEYDWKYKADGNGDMAENPEPAKFAGVMFLKPENNFGDLRNGGMNLQAVRRQLRWEACCDEGDVNVRFSIGGISWKWLGMQKTEVAYPDSMPKVTLARKGENSGADTDIFPLTEQYQTFTADLSKYPADFFRQVENAFAVTIDWASNNIPDRNSGRTFTIRIKNIEYLE